jgi:hypothetical protein
VSPKTIAPYDVDEIHANKNDKNEEHETARRRNKSATAVSDHDAKLQSLDDLVGAWLELEQKAKSGVRTFC